MHSRNITDRAHVDSRDHLFALFFTAVSAVTALSCVLEDRHQSESVHLRGRYVDNLGVDSTCDSLPEEIQLAVSCHSHHTVICNLCSSRGALNLIQHELPPLGAPDFRWRAADLWSAALRELFDVCCFWTDDLIMQERRFLMAPSVHAAAQSGNY